MFLLEKINQDYLLAYKSHDEVRVSTLRMLRSALKNTEINNRVELKEDDVITVIKREMKQRQEAKTEYEKGDRPELAAKEAAEIEILKTYLPQQLDLNTLKEIVDQTIHDLNAADPSQTGRVIGAVMQKVKGKADGGDVARLVNEHLRKK